MRNFKPKIVSFQAKVVGITFNNGRVSRQSIIKNCCRVGDKISLIDEPDNIHDSNAVMVCLSDGQQIGYLSETCAEVTQRKKLKKEGSNLAAFIFDVRSRDVYSVIITIVDWNNAVNTSDALHFLETERQNAMASVMTSNIQGKIDLTNVQITINKMVELTLQGFYFTWKFYKKVCKKIIKWSKSAWIAFVNSQ